MDPNPSKFEALFLDIKMHFDVLGCSETQNVAFSTIMLVGEANIDGEWRKDS